MDKYRKLVVRTLQKLIAIKHTEDIKAYGDSELLPNCKVHDDLLIREVLNEHMMQRYLKALRVATHKPISFSDRMTVGDLVKTLNTP
ncbi:hypothetical protein [Pseudomonas sp. NBRC 111124]|uniref:hypothetical protein n=1 Tax=Pseudomonas sp. NBRC 111124 TaxID=1661039 RepID=UPI000761E6A5|nr:hypothetical protein [Pseudomonas sp. NBRC 111124]